MTAARQDPTADASIVNAAELWNSVLFFTRWFHGELPSGYVKIAIENDPVEIVDLPIKHGDFP